MNLSFETIELLGAREWKGFQFTAGPSYILHTDSDLKRSAFNSFYPTQLICRERPL